MAELGPGDTLGVGLAALLSGAERYIGLDVKRFAAEKNNTNILTELAALMEERADIPAPDVLPHVKPYLGDYAFPADVVTPALLAQTLSPHNMQVLRDALVYPEDGPIRYVVPWTSDSIGPASLDMILAQAVMEYVTDIEAVYKTLARWLAPGGFVSLQVDLKCHGCAQEWNGHYAYSDRAWELIKAGGNFI